MSLTSPVALALALSAASPPNSTPAEPPAESGEAPTEAGGDAQPKAPACADQDDREVLPSVVLRSVPDVSLVQAWTIEHAGLDGVDTRALLDAARARAALPRIRLSAGYDDDDRVDRDAFDRVEDHREVSAYSLDLQLEWDLAELASGVDTYRAVREGRAQLELKHALVTQATTIYFDRLRLAVDESTRCAAGVAEARERRLRLRELDATLDGLTGGRWRAAFEDAPAPDPGTTSSPRGATPDPPESESP